MKQKAFVLQNKGMNRDLSISKAGESSAYENHNIRILARDHDTLLSVTNERGNKLVYLQGLQNDAFRITEDEELRFTEDELFRLVADGDIDETIHDFEGILIGWNVLNSHVILFTHQSQTDRIYRVDYDGSDFYPVLLFRGNLGFDLDYPIESIVYHETNDIQKIYWVDGKNVLRFMNFMEKPDEETGLFPWQTGENEYDSTYFDSNRAARFDAEISIRKENSGNNRANGVVQYLLTYFNKHGQETGYVWVSDLIYLSPFDRGGSADGTNVNSVILDIKNLDTSFDHFRIYSIFRSALNGTVVSYLVEEGKTIGGSATVIDDGAHLTLQDANRLLYLGSLPVHARTLTHKDQTLFLGNLQSVGHDYTDIENAIKEYTIYKEGNIYGYPYGTSTCITFDYADKRVPYVENESTYPYENQLRYSSSEITTFKGGEKYRFAIKFQLRDGTESPAFWIGDWTNYLYPVIDEDAHNIKKVVAYCTLPDEVVQEISSSDLDIETVQLCIAEATYADRSIKAQGILSPTMFNTWDRYNKRTYAIPSWISRPRNMSYATRHFQPVNNAEQSTGEIDCNWWDDSKPTPNPYYRYMYYGSPQQQYMYDYGGMDDYEYLIVAYEISLHKDIRFDFGIAALVFKVEAKSQNVALAKQFRFGYETAYFYFQSSYEWTLIAETDDFKIYAQRIPLSHTEITAVGSNYWWDGIKGAYGQFAKYMREHCGFTEAAGEIVGENTIESWFSIVNSIANCNRRFFLPIPNTRGYDDILNCLNDGASESETPSVSRWIDGDSVSNRDEGSYIPAFYQKHLMFVDENVVTLNSPEIDYDAVSIDQTNLKLRIVGVAKITSGVSDYTVIADPGRKPGENVIDDRFSWTKSFGNPNGLVSWPLWHDTNLELKKVDDEGEPIEDEDIPDVDKRDSSNYIWGSSSVRYWLHMWNRSGIINGYVGEDNMDYGLLTRKVFANLKFSYNTVYASAAQMHEYDCNVRQYNYLSSQYIYTKVGNENKYYNGNVQMSLLPPGRMKYPLIYSVGDQNTDSDIGSGGSFLYSQDPVQIEYLSGPHMVISLDAGVKNDGYYHQTILPYVFDSEDMNGSMPAHGLSTTGALLPWMDQTTPVPCQIDERKLVVPGMTDGDKYVFIGELYQEYDSEHPDTRYGGTTEMDVTNCRFISAGPQFVVSDLGQNDNLIYADQGDTFFQRWDCLKTKPYSTGAVNNVIDITSVMVETHINIDGRTDLQRGIDKIASIDVEKFGSLNPVYTQPNNYRIQRDLDEDFNTDSYHSSITWTLEKHDSADVDEWSHVTLASTLKLDGDKGECNALRRMGNSIIAFQDRGISEILFNSRTQLSTQDGVPVEIANSGKVDGKRYITNKYGCVNKWSIVEGKNALYFVDNINKAFCAFNGQAIDNLSTRLGFGAWFREINDTNAWTPNQFNNIVSYYDKVHSDIYLVRNTDDDKPCLVYNETLGAFTSFFDYRAVLMMANVNDRFLSYKRHSLWLQNEGLYCNFFGHQYDYWMQYRVTPEPFSDKIWTNIDYRADFYEVLDENGNSSVPETHLINGDAYGELTDTYKEWETFTDYKVWDEYQTTNFVPFAHEHFDRDDVRKKFRIWRLAIPRAIKEGTNRYGMDRIRNPWVNLLFRKNEVDGKYLMQLHDIVVKYFE